MTIVYGGCIEPGGMKLDDNCCDVKCPSCGKPNATSRFWEMNDGGCINSYKSIYCKDCGYFEGDDPYDDHIESIGPYDLLSKVIGYGEYCPGEVALEFLLDGLHSRVDESCNKAVADIEYQCKQAINTVYQNFA